MLRRLFWLELTSSTLVIGVVAAGLGVAIALTNMAYTDPYWLDLSSKSTGSILLLAPALAALSAWDAARWTVLVRASVRPWWELLARHLVIVALLASVTFAVTLAIFVAAVEPSPGLPDVAVMATGVWMVTAYAAVGFALGRFLPPMISAVSAFALVWLWVAYTPAIPPFWMRNATGNLAASCCSVDRELVDGALAAPALLGAALVVAAAVVACRPRWSSAVVVAVVMGAALTLSAQWMSDVGADPVQARTGQMECVEAGSTTLCAWPEHAERLREAAPPLAAAADRLRSAGLDAPRRISENAEHASNPWSFSLGADSADEWVQSLASSPLRALPPTCIEEHGGLWPAGDDEPLAAAWLMATAGIDTQVAVEQAEANRAKLDALLAETPGDQQSWFKSRLAAMSTCDASR